MGCLLWLQRSKLHSKHILYRESAATPRRLRVGLTPQRDQEQGFFTPLALALSRGSPAVQGVPILQQVPLARLALGVFAASEGCYPRLCMSLM